MPIHVRCRCGRSLKIREELAGRKIRCPQCQGIVPVPQKPDAEEEALAILLADPPAEPQLPARAGGHELHPELPPAASSRTTRPGSPGLPPLQAGEVKKPARRPRRPRGEWSIPSISVHPEIITGLLMMLGAAVWFFVGLAAGRIFFYPPILFVLGIGAVIRGFTGGD